MMALAVTAPIPLGHMLGNDKGFFHQFDLLDDFLLIGVQLQAMVRITRTTLEFIVANMIDLLRTKSRAFLFRVAGLASDFTAFTPRPLGQRWFDNIAGRRFRRIARAFGGGGQLLHQFLVLGFGLLQARLELGILSFEQVAALFPVQESHG